MTLNSLFFVFLFLPLGFLLQKLTPPKGKNIALLLLSLVFLAWGNPRDMLLILASVFFQYFTALQMESMRRNNRKELIRPVFVTGVVFNLLLLFFFKYTGFAFGVFGAAPPFTLPAAPIGISFYTFSAISFLADVKNGDEKAPASFIDAALYLTFFPKFISGPIVTYRDFAKQLRERDTSLSAVEEGFTRFAVGLGKKLLLADTLGISFSAVAALPAQSLSVAQAWLGLLLYAFMLYFDFSGYSDMAIGLAGTCGFSFRENFDYPYLSESITVFWRKWHISLGRWFRDYVYIPLGGSHKGNARTALNIAIVWLLTGLWHGAAWTFVVWGAYHAVLLLLEKFVFAGVKSKLPRSVNIILTVPLAILGWVPFFSESLPYAWTYLTKLFGFGGGILWNDSTLYVLRQCGIWLVIAVICSTPLVRNFFMRLHKSDAYIPVKAALVTLLLAACVAAMISGTYQTFLYAQF